MTTVYGASDDLIEFEGDIYEEIAGSEDPTFLMFGDGTILKIWYGKDIFAIWSINVINKGSLFDKIEYCNDENADIYSDIVTFKDGLKSVYSAKEKYLTKVV